MTWRDFLNFEIVRIGDGHNPYVLQTWNFVLMLCVLFGTILLLGLLKNVIAKPRLLLSHVDKKRRHSIYLLVKYFVFVISFVLMLETIEIDVGLLLGASAAVLVGIGLGLQSIFSDLVSGLFLLFEGTIKIGDVVESDDGVIGRVTEINLRSSEVLTRDNVVVIIPNSKFVTERVINWSHNMDSVRFNVSIGVAYGSDVDQVYEILESVMSGHEHIEVSPSPFVRFVNFGDSSLDFELFFWTKEVFTVENLKSDLRRTIHRNLKKEGIAIPFPQRDIHIISKKED